MTDTTGVSETLAVFLPKGLHKDNFLTFIPDAFLLAFGSVSDLGQFTVQKLALSHLTDLETAQCLCAYSPHARH